MMGPGLEFHSDARNGVLLCHPLPCDAFTAVTDLSENYVQMQMETLKKALHRKISGVFDLNASREKKGLYHKLAEILVQYADQDQTKGLDHKLVEFSAELWFHIIKQCHFQMVTPGAGCPTAANVLLLSTQLNYRANFHIILMTKLFAAFMTSFQ